MPDLAAFADRYLTLVLGVNTLLHEIGIPLPLMPTALLAGARAGEGEASVAVLLLVVIAGTLIGNGVWYAAGRLYGSRVLKTLCRLSLSPDSCVGRTESAFTRWGRWSLVLGHFLPGVSLVAPPLAGALGMRLPVFLGLTVAGGALYGVVTLGAGMLFSGSILALAEAVLARGTESIAAVALLCAAYAAWKWWRRRIAARALQAPRISVAELKAALLGDEPPLIVDVRGEASRQGDSRHIPGALFATHGDMLRLLDPHPKSALIVVYCNCPNDASAAQAVLVLMQAGYVRARTLNGGVDAWFEDA